MRNAAIAGSPDVDRAGKRAFPSHRRRHGNLRKIHAGKTAAYSARPRDRARNAKSQPVGSFVADNLQRQARRRCTFQPHRSIFGFSKLRLSVVRNPPIAGPKPTQAMSTAICCRSIVCRSVFCCSTRRPDLGIERSCGVVQRLRNHELRNRLGGAVFRKPAAGEASSELVCNERNWSAPLHFAHGPAFWDASHRSR